MGISEWRYHVGLLVFATTVVAYTLAGGFLAAVWTDLFQSVLMFAGVMLLLVACLSAVGGLEQATLRSLANTGPGFVFGPGYAADGSGHQFLPLSLAISFLWCGSGAAWVLLRVWCG